MTTEYEIFMEIGVDDGELAGYLTAWPYVFDSEPNELGIAKGEEGIYGLMSTAYTMVKDAGYAWSDATDEYAVVDAWEWSSGHNAFRRMATADEYELLKIACLKRLPELAGHLPEAHEDKDCSCPVHNPMGFVNAADEIVLNGRTYRALP